MGRYIIDLLLREGHQVVALQRSAHPDLQRRGVEVVQGDLCDADAVRAALRGCDTVLHVAAKAGVWGNRRAFFAANVDGTAVLRQAMTELGIRRMVYCSTPSVVFNGSAFNGADESLPYGRNWLCAYAESKAQAEESLLEWGRLHGNRVIALRPHLIWGVGDPHLLPRVIERSQQGRLRIVGDGQNRVDVTRVENAAMAHVLALRALDRPEAYNRPYFISQGEPVLLWPWINDLLALVGVEPLRKRISARAAYGVGAICEGIWRIRRCEEVPPMTRFVAVELSKSHWFSIRAAREHLGYQPESFPTEAGMQHFAAHWLAQQEKK